MMDSIAIDDEHKLIARYAQHLSTSPAINGNSVSNGVLNSFVNQENYTFNTDPQQRLHQELILDLETKNRIIMEEIAQLKLAKESDIPNPDLMFELQMLKHHKGELESRMGQLQDGRKDLIQQLERLMTLLKVKSKGSYSPPIKAKISPPTTARLERLQNESSGGIPCMPSRTKNMFVDLFTAADAINAAMSDLVVQVSPQ